MEVLLAVTIGALFASGVFLMLRPLGFPIVQGLTLVSHGMNLLLVSMGRVRLGQPPLLEKGQPLPLGVADPLAQALVLTAIVISFGMTAFLLVLVYQAYQRDRHEGVDLEAHDG